MKKTVEILNKIEKLKNEMTVLKDNGNIDLALEKVNEINNLKKELTIAEMEEEEIKLENKVEIGQPKQAKADVNKVLNKALRGLELSEIENAVIEQTGDPNGGEFIVPIEQIQRIEEYKKTLISLKSKCEVIPVNKPKGTMPVHNLTDDGLKKTEELGEIDPSDIQFTNIKFNIEDYADLIFVSNDIYNDTTYDLTGIINKNFARKAVKTENDLIIDVLNQCTAKKGTNNKVIDTAINTVLDPAIAQIAEIITDQDGYNYLDSLEDKIGRPLLTDSLTVPGAKEYRGKVITVLRNGAFTKPKGSLVFYVGSVEESVAFFDREQVVISVSNDFAFNKRAKTFLVGERIDTELKDSNGCAVVTITPSTTTAATPAA